MNPFLRMNLLCRPFHIPAAKPSGEARVDVFKEQMLLLTLNENREAVTGAVVVCCASRPKVSDGLNGKGPAVCPSDGGRQHIASRIKFRGNLHIDALDLGSFWNSHVGHLPLLKMTGIIRNDTEEVSVGHIGEAESVVIIHLLQLQQQQVHIGAKLPSNLDDVKTIADQFLN